MQLSRLDQKGLILGVKRGMTLESFCEKFQCSEKEFEKQIMLLYSNNPRQPKKILDQIKANEKKAKKVKEEVKPEVTNETLETQETLESLESLQKLEKAQSDEVIALELKREELKKARHQLRNQLREKRDEYRELTATAERIWKDCELIAANYNDLAKQSNEVFETLREKAEKLDVTRAKIRELNTVTLFAFDSGEISSENKAVVLDDAGADELFGELIYKDECQNLKARDIRMLARVLKISENAEHDVEAVFENPETEVAYRALTKSNFTS